MTLYDTFSSPFGEIIISTNGTHITSFHFLGQRYFENIQAEWKEDTNHPLLLKAKKQLQEYFAQERREFDLPLLAEGTPFQKQVWQEVAKIPYGLLTTYRTIAEKIGNPKAVRAVGTAIGKNPLCIIVPCHRVVSTQGTMAGYAGGIERKEKLLNLEGSYQKINDIYPAQKFSLAKV